ncbi:MAG: hypothetical protein JST00_16125 [Deltaproteobacteria bacterium]|nr:hypothetical protein [Deltaproteobacteria bacterium]
MSEREGASGEARDGAQPGQDEGKGAAPSQADPFERAKLPMLGAAVGIAAGLAIAGSVDKTSGGAIVLASWLVGVAALHRLGRAGSRPRA